MRRRLPVPNLERSLIEDVHVRWPAKPSSSIFTGCFTHICRRWNITFHEGLRPWGSTTGGHSFLHHHASSRWHHVKTELGRSCLSNLLGWLQIHLYWPHCGFRNFCLGKRLTLEEKILRWSFLWRKRSSFQLILQEICGYSRFPYNLVLPYYILGNQTDILTIPW